jgi:serine/threonine protein kinase
MSPEQMKGAQAGPESDVFSLGGVLVYALSGHPPHGMGEAVRYQVVFGAPDLDGVPHTMRPLIAHCLAKRPADRPRLAELLAELCDEAPQSPSWPPPKVRRTIEVRVSELNARRRAGTSVSVPSCLMLHAQALLDAGLTDAMVARAVDRGTA